MSNLTRRSVLLLAATVPVSCAHPIAPDRRDDSSYWGALSKQLHAELFTITDQEIVEHRIALDDGWLPGQFNQDVMVNVFTVPTRVRTI